MSIIANGRRLVNYNGGIYRALRGVELRKYGEGSVPIKGGRPAGSVITGFSVDARRRLRMALLTADMDAPHWVCGITLTLPWGIPDGQWAGNPMDEFKRSLNRFSVSFRRRWPHSAVIYRVELQQRGAPHVHGVVWIDNRDCVCDRILFAQRIFSEWTRAIDLPVSDWVCIPDWNAYIRHGVSVDEIASTGAIIRYLADHASKRKQAQLGYKGKQWGYIARSNLVARPLERVDLPPRVETLVKRAIRRYSRYTLNRGNHSKAPFGSHKAPGRVVYGARYGITPAMLDRFIEWAFGEVGDGAAAGCQ